MLLRVPERGFDGLAGVPRAAHSGFEKAMAERNGLSTDNLIW
jgi:hypothetical protein